MAQDVPVLASTITADVKRRLAAMPLAQQLAVLLYTAAPADGLAVIGADRLVVETQEALSFLTEKPKDRHKIRVRPARDGTSTLVEITNDDMPFLVDSVMGEIQARGHEVRLALHPIFKTARSADRHLTAILGPADQNWTDGNQESLIIVHLAPMTPAAGEELGRALSDILGEVRVAVADWKAMSKRVESAIKALENAGTGIVPAVRSELLAFLRWLVGGHFTFLGVREFRMQGSGHDGELNPIDGTGLGVLRDTTVEVLSRQGAKLAMTPEMRRDFLSPEPLIITKANVVSRVHRRGYMDYVGIKTYGAGVEPTGEIRLVGLFTSQAYTQSTAQIPFLRRKVENTLAASGYPTASHAGKALANVLDTFPRDELFQIDERELKLWSEGILDLELRPRVRVFTRADRFNRFISVLLYAPRDRWTTRVRERIGALLSDIYKGRIAAFYPYFPDGPLVRMQFIVARGEGTIDDSAVNALEAQIAAIVRTWEDQLAETLDQSSPAGSALLIKYGSAFSAGYAEAFSTDRARADIERIERLSPDRPVAIDFYREPGAPPHRVRAAIYRFGDPIRLSERVPLLENLGFSVIDERSYRISPRIDGAVREVVLHDMVLESADGQPLDLEAHDSRLEECFLAVFHGRADNDSFNRLVVAAGADWRDASVMRAYAAFLRQLGSPFGLRYLADTLNRHAGVARDLLELFHIRFNPDRPLADRAARKAAEGPVRSRIAGALVNVESLDEDRILRQLLSVIDGTVRTNFFQRDASARAPETLAFKLSSRDIEAVPPPRPFREIWVYAPRVEGVHLRFAPIARGGIRWSDRAQDFRTEVLGLVKAQLVKNAVIVPSGSKGGFLPKQLPRAGSREEIMKEGVAAYRIFISALLDVTDNIVDGHIVPPPRVIRYDADDPYLVVAADKGTATFSDFANALSAERGHWLGDAFASGGSAGYDHKKMAITARGAWECVKRHFREMGTDIQKVPFRVVGVGDMSGDVFGNGMLLSPVTRLVAAFDHRDIFIDPNPDAHTSFLERKRLFDLPRSSWADYDRHKISAGGGVFPRSAKTIKLSAEIRAALGLEKAEATPAEVMRAILKCDADLLWFGGIGTYIRASNETDLDAGDRANDALRITAPEIRAKVIAEGANLGLTQRGRIEFAGRGGRLNTDFIDNSAGVNSSDQEVNIKIAFGPALQSKRLDIAGRNVILTTMTDEVAAACLRNNYQQSLALSLAERRSAAEAGYLARLMRDLEGRGLLDRGIEQLPSDSALIERQRAGRPLTRPELAVLLSYSKIALTEDLLASKVPDEPLLERWLLDYFPTRMREEFPADLKQHRLRREIIATALTNAFVNRGGPALAVRLADETGRGTADAAKAYLAVRSVFGPPELAASIDALDGQIDGAVQLDMHQAVQDLVQRQTLWFLKNGRALDDLAGTIARHTAGVKELGSALESLLSTERKVRIERMMAELTGKGVPADLARDIARLELLALAPEITEIAQETGRSTAQAAQAFFAIGDAFKLAELAAKTAMLAPSDYFDRLALASASNQILAAQHVFTRDVLRAAPDKSPDIAAWLAAKGERHARAQASLSQIAMDGALTVSRLTVAAGQLRDLAG